MYIFDIYIYNKHFTYPVLDQSGLFLSYFIFILFLLNQATQVHTPKFSPMTQDSKKANHTYTIVIKLGSSSLIDSETKEPKLATQSLVVETVMKLRHAGHRVIIVSSGSIALAMGKYNLKKRPKSLAKVQALAAVGQGRLIARWDMLFQQFYQRTAQILLTRNDIAEYTHYINAQNTILELLNMGVVPIVNENDTVSVSEIQFGDNDTLSAITAALVHADYLFLLTDVECLYTDNPRTHPETAKPIVLVPNLAAGLPGVNTSSGSGSCVGTGGMKTKLIAADLATNAGVHTVIMSSGNPAGIAKIVEYIQGIDRSVEDKLLHYDGDLMELQERQLKKLEAAGVPRHTMFISNDVKHHLKNKQFWLLHGLVPHGAIIVDKNAYEAISRKERAGLLPIGLIGVEGFFHEMECVEIKVGKLLPNSDQLDPSVPLEVVGRARCNYNSVELAKIKGLHSPEIEGALGYCSSEYVAHRANIAFPPNLED